MATYHGIPQICPLCGEVHFAAYIGTTDGSMVGGRYCTRRKQFVYGPSSTRPLQAERTPVAEPEGDTGDQTK